MVLRDHDRYACVVHAGMDGQDFYCGSLFKNGARLRQTLHKDGRGHIYVLGKQRMVGSHGEPMESFSGIDPVWGGTLNALELLDWSYRPKLDIRGKRLSLFLSVDDLTPSCNVTVWLAERRLENELRAEWHRRHEVIAGYRVAGWVTPIFAVVVGTVTGPAPPNPLIRKREGGQPRTGVAALGAMGSSAGALNEAPPATSRRGSGPTRARIWAARRAASWSPRVGGPGRSPRPASVNVARRRAPDLGDHNLAASGGGDACLNETVSTVDETQRQVVGAQPLPHLTR